MAGTTSSGIRTDAVDGDTFVSASGDVFGATAGIRSAATGTGDVTIVTDERVEASGGPGIFGQVASGNLTIVTDVGNPGDGNVRGQTDGIFGIATGAGNIVVVTNDRVVGLTQSGIETNAQGGATTIVANGNVRGEIDGILSQSTTGNINVTTNDVARGVTGSGVNPTTGGAGLVVVNANDGGVPVDVRGAVAGIDTTAGSGLTDINIGANTTVAGVNASGTGAGVSVATAGNASIHDLRIEGILDASGVGGTVTVTNVVIDAAAGTTGGFGVRADATAGGNIDVSGANTVDSIVRGFGGGLNGCGFTQTQVGSIDTDFNNANITGPNGVCLTVTGANSTIDTTIQNSTITGTAGDGLRTRAVDGTTTIAVLNSTIAGSDDGIDSRAATGDIVTTINASTVSGGDDGIRNETGGDVALGVTNGSSVTGAAGDGIDIDAGGNALVVVNASTVTGADEGIIADAGGTVGIAVLNGSAVTGTAGDGIDALAGTNVGVVVSASAVEGGEDGISALAGGSVGIAVLNGSTVTGNGSNGIDGSAGGNIGLLVNASDVQGNGYGAILNAGGSVVIAALNGSSIIGTGADGIEAVAGTNAFIVLNDSTVEGGANGILTNAGGNIGIAVLNGSSVDGNAGDGIEAVAGGAIGVGVSDSTVEGGVNGIFADAGGAITIGVVSGGTVTGTAEDGIRTIGDNAPTVILVNASTVTGGDDGIDATALAGAISTAVIGGTVTGANLATGFGIVQASAGNQLVVADDGSRVTGGTGISASTTGLASTVTVVVADNSFVNGTVLDGVATNAVNGTTTITVANAKIADLPNPQNGNGLRGAQDGIDARASGTGEIDITLANADVRGVAGAAIQALGTDGEITIAIDDASTAIGATGVRFGSNGATSTLTNDGVIRATGAGALDGAVVTVGTAASVNRVINTGLIETTSLATVPSLFNQGGTILFDNDAGGVLNGHVEALAGTTSIFDNNPGAIWNFQGAGTLAGNETVNNSGTFNIVNGGGTMTGLETFNNFGAGRVNFGTQATPASGSLTGIGVFNNDSIIYAAGSQGAPLAATLGVAQFNNQDQGIIRLTKDVTAPGFGVNYDPTNAANNSTADQFTITGNYTGTAGSLLEVDLDLTRTTDAGGLRADRLNINGVSGGQTNVGYNIVGNSRVFLQQPILVVNTTPGSPVDFNGAAIPSFGLVNYDFVEFTPGQFGILSTINAAAAIGPLAAITAATTSINTGFFQGSSAFITGPTDPRPNHWAWGPWIRYSAGESRVDAHGVATLPFGGNQTADARVKNDFSGFQVGVDTGLYNINGSGYSAHLGVTAGVIDANARERVGATSVNFDIPYFGVYGAITGNGFSADLSVRRDNYNMRVTNETARVFRDKLDGEGTTVNASIAYKHQLSNSFFVEPSAQLIWSRTSVDSLDLGEQPGLSGNFGQFRFRDIDSLLGRVGVRVGTTFQLGSFGVQPFMAAHLWHEFEDHAQATFVAPGNVDIPLSVNRVGTFGQVGAGVSAQLLQTGLFGFVRGDVRFGDRIEGTAFNAGLRYQF